MAKIVCLMILVTCTALALAKDSNKALVETTSKESRPKKLKIKKNSATGNTPKTDATDFAAQSIAKTAPSSVADLLGPSSKRNANAVHPIGAEENNSGGKSVDVKLNSEIQESLLQTAMSKKGNSHGLIESNSNALGNGVSTVSSKFGPAKMSSDDAAKDKLWPFSDDGDASPATTDATDFEAESSSDVKQKSVEDILGPHDETGADDKIGAAQAKFVDVKLNSELQESLLQTARSKKGNSQGLVISSNNVLDNGVSTASSKFGPAKMNSDDAAKDKWWPFSDDGDASPATTDATDFEAESSSDVKQKSVEDILGPHDETGAEDKIGAAQAKFVDVKLNSELQESFLQVASSKKERVNKLRR